MTVLDFILLIILFGFVLSGLWLGLIQTLGALVGTVAGIAVASRYFEQFQSLIQPFFGANENLAKIIAFIIIFIIINRLVGVIFWLINKVFKFISVIPFLKTINRLAGGILGFLEGVIILGVVLLMIGKYPIGDFMIPAMQGSQVTQWLLGIGAWFTPLLPEIVQQVKGYWERLPELPDKLPQIEVNIK